MLLLTETEIVEATGLKQPEKQKAWFISHGFKAMLGADGKCKITRDHYLQMMGAGIRAKQKARPKFELLNC